MTTLAYIPRQKQDSGRSEPHRPIIAAVAMLSLRLWYVRVSLQAQSHLQCLGMGPSSATSALQPVDLGTRPALDVSGAQAAAQPEAPITRPALPSQPWFRLAVKFHPGLLPPAKG